MENAPRIAPGQWGVAIALGLLLFSLTFSGDILQRGQVVKQFHSFGITRSLAENGFSLFHTSIPCTDTRDGSFPRPWAEEPPVFHVVAAAFQNVGLAAPQWPSVLVALALSLVVLWMLLGFHDGPAARVPLIFLGALAVPVFMRFYAQHMPDLMSVLWLAAAVVAYLHGARLACVALLTLAVTTKALAVIPSAGILAWMYLVEPAWRGSSEKSTLRALRFGLSLALTVSVFWLWCLALDEKGVPNPFNFSSVVRNRHSGTWDILLTAHYWDRFLTFVGMKGVGWLLFAAFLWRVGHLVRHRHEIDSLHGVLIFWALSMFPFWLLVRSASFGHDYYVLQYFLPVSILGMEALLAVPIPAVRHALLALSLYVGLASPVIELARAPGMSLASQCAQEDEALKSFPLRGAARKKDPYVN